MKIGMAEGKLIFINQRQVPCVEKWIGTTRLEIRRMRAPIRKSFLKRAGSMASTALFASMLIPDWKRIMPDERRTLRKILHHSERVAVSAGDWQRLAGWYKTMLHDEEKEEFCREQSKLV